MGYQRDQTFARATYRPGSQAPPGDPKLTGPPPLPPRGSSTVLSPASLSPPTYDNAVYGYHSQPLTHSWSDQDPRERSTESLLPSPGGRDGRRKLLLIYIHGFLGSETSFQSFPAHVHNFVVTKLIDTHVVHTKIYPRYKSRKAIEYARDDFSTWLDPHESPDTDVILLGHSMGGILSAEVALLSPFSAANRSTFRHRILGTISFDTPFLGMHPGVIISGIGSLFQPKPASPTLKPEDALSNAQTLLPVPPKAILSDGIMGNSSGVRPQRSQTSLASEYFSAQGQTNAAPSGAITPQSTFSPLATPINDPNYNPPFPNDVRLPIRKGWDSTLHFIMKHSDGLTKATKSYVTSHLEFGGCLADYRSLKNRYERIRALEDVKESSESPPQTYRPAKRVRFVNYYTASTGRVKTPKLSVTPNREQLQNQTDGTGSEVDQDLQSMSLASDSIRSASRSPRISIEDPHGIVVAEILQETGGHEGDHEGDSKSKNSQEMARLSPDPVSDSELQTGDGIFDGDPRTPQNPKTHPLASPPPLADPPTTPSATTSLLPPSQSESPSSTLSLPPLPPSPTAPPPFDPTPYTDKDARKLAEKDHARLSKAYQRAVKDRDSAIKDRRKLLEKREKAARQAREKALKAEEKQRLKEEKEEAKGANEAEKAVELPVTGSTSTEPEKSHDETNCLGADSDVPGAKERTHNSSSAQPLTADTVNATGKKKRDRKFCMLPPRLDSGERDPCWFRVYMEGVDEVGAHCGLFVAGKPHYEGLVIDVGERVEVWVREREGSGRGWA